MEIKKLKPFLAFNVVIALILFLLLSGSLLFPHPDNWIYFPVFTYHFADQNTLHSLFLHGYIMNFNLGFITTFVLLIFSFMVFFANKRVISFIMVYMMVVIRSLLMLSLSMQNPVDYFSEDGLFSINAVHIGYLIFFALLILLVLIFDSKKRPRIPEPFEIIKD